MKRILYLFTVLFGVLLLTGCGKNIKTLTCRLEQKINGQYGSMIIEEKVTYNEDTAEFEKLHYRLTVDLTDETTISDAKKEEALKALKTNLDKLCEDALKNGASTCTVTTPKQFQVEINSEGDVTSGAIDNAVANLGTLEEMKTYFEGQNYTCKEE